MLIIILMIKMRYIVLPIIGVLYFAWSVKALQDFNSDDKKVKGYTVIWTIVTFIAGIGFAIWGLSEAIPFVYENW